MADTEFDPEKVERLYCDGNIAYRVLDGSAVIVRQIVKSSDFEQLLDVVERLKSELSKANAMEEQLLAAGEKIAEGK